MLNALNATDIALSVTRHHHHAAGEDVWSRESIGSLMGWISIGCESLLPQIYENYRLKSGEGLSVVFLFIWLVGDITGFVGAALQHLAVTVQGLALYFALADMTLLGQLYFYRRRRRLHPELYAVSAAGASHITDPEQEPLVGAAEHSAYGTNETSKAAGNVLPKGLSERTKSVLIFLATLVFIAVFAFVSWDAAKAGQRSGGGRHQRPAETWNTTAQVVGWISAALYLGARIPQLRRNVVTACSGLSMSFFLLSLIGNVSYSLSILVPSLDRTHLVLNASWLLGSAGTLVLDFACLGQFWAYRHRRRELMEQGGLQ